MTRYGMIMAGGRGTRLWPMSRTERPKQLLPLIDGRSLLELAADRLDRLVDVDHRYICTGESHRQVVREALPAFDDEHILGEPCGMNTLNAVGLTAAVVGRRDTAAVMAVLTGDHVIEPIDTVRAALATGFELVEQNPMRMVTFAIVPRSPATQYGYVVRGDAIDGFEDAWVVSHFKEKPSDAAAAQALIDAGGAWNSGMFIFSAAGVLDAIKRYAPKSYEGLMRIADAWGTPDRRQVLAETYPMLERNSIDIGVMEHAAGDSDFQVCAVAMDVSWLDVGSWPSFAERADEDPKTGNRAHGTAAHIDSTNMLTVSDNPNHLIATIGCENLIIVHTADATLVVPRDRAEQVKDMADLVPTHLQ